METQTVRVSTRTLVCPVNNTRVLRAMPPTTGDNRGTLIVTCSKCDTTDQIHGDPFAAIDFIANRFRERDWVVDSKGRAAKCPGCVTKKRKKSTPEPTVSEPIESAATVAPAAEVTGAPSSTAPMVRPSVASLTPLGPNDHPSLAGIVRYDVLVGPKQARELIARNHGSQRALSQRKVREWAGQMRRGEWRYNGDSVRYTKSGWMVDGQHRLNAVILADVEIVMHVVEGLDDDVFAKIDVGMVRTPGHILQMAGYSCGTQLGATIACLSRLENAHVLGVLDESDLHKDDLVPYARAHEVEISPLLNIYHRAKHHELSPPSAIAAAFTFIRRWALDTNVLDTFIDSVLTGANLGSNDVRLSLRNKLHGTRSRSAQLTQSEAMVYCIQGWGMFLRGLSKGLVTRETDGHLNMPPIYVDERRVALTDGRHVVPSVQIRLWDRNESDS